MLSPVDIWNAIFDSTNKAARVEIVAGGSSTPTTILDGRQTVPTPATPVALIGSATPIRSVVITAETDNTGVISVGGSDVLATLATRKGTPLSAGESISFDINDLSKIYIDSTVATDGITYTAVV